jgi:hypothetical protein
VATSDGRARARHRAAAGDDLAAPGRAGYRPAAARGRERDAGRASLMGWLGSGRNIAGCVGAIVGVVLGVAGVVPDPWWPAGVAALYGAGALAYPRRAGSDVGTLNAAEPVDVERLRSAARAHGRSLVGRAPTVVIRATDEVIVALDDLFDRPELLRRGSQEADLVERLVGDYLPTSLAVYLSLPRTYAGQHRRPDGRTPRDVLIDQLALLRRAVREVTEDASSGEANRLLAHERFLANRFSPNALEIPDRPASAAGAGPTEPFSPGPTD